LTVPVDETVAMLVLSDDHVTVTSGTSAPLAYTGVAVSC
jgi:hypothetical protein